jgi:hypothetical protein
MASVIYLKLQKEKEQLLREINALSESKDGLKLSDFNEQSASLSKKGLQFISTVKSNFARFEKDELQPVNLFVKEINNGLKQLGIISTSKFLGEGENLETIMGNLDSLQDNASNMFKRRKPTPKQTIIAYRDSREDEPTKFFFARFFRTGYSKTDKVNAADALISVMNGNQVDLTTHMGALKQGRLGTLVKEMAREKGLDATTYLNSLSDSGQSYTR